MFGSRKKTAYFNQSSQVYSIIKDILGKSTTNTTKLVNKWNGESPGNNNELIKKLDRIL